MIALALLALALPAATLPSPVRPEAAPPFAVVELFTSEGCSSCPPADALLGEIAAAARRDHRAVYALAYHVDYWDDLGWVDPFGSPAFTERQRRYTRTFHLQSSYTPQVVVNGRRQLVGSRRRELQDAIDEALHRPSRVRVSVRGLHPEGAQAMVLDYQVTGAASDARVRGVLVEDGIVRDIGAGENRGQRLRHDRVVRAFQSATVGEGAGQLRFAIKGPQGNGGTSAILFVEDPRTMEILGATEADISHP